MSTSEVCSSVTKFVFLDREKSCGQEKLPNAFVEGT